MAFVKKSKDRCDPSLELQLESDIALVEILPLIRFHSINQNNDELNYNTDNLCQKACCFHAAYVGNRFVNGGIVSHLS